MPGSLIARFVTFALALSAGVATAGVQKDAQKDRAAEASAVCVLKVSGMT